MHQAKPFLKAGFWRNFFAKYPEANQMHKRMLQVRQELEELEKRPDLSPASLAPIRDLVFAAQCNCPYWHGVFGGLYLTNLRHAIYQHLIRAQVEIDRLKNGPAENPNGWVHVDQSDMNCDGFAECIVDTDRMRLFFSPQRGASLFEWDFKSCEINLVDTLTRREEGYHRKLVDGDPSVEEPADDLYTIHDVLRSKEEGLEEYLDYDWYQRVGMVDHFLHPDTQLEWFSRAKYGEQGDFVEHPFDLQIEKTRKKARLSFSRDGHVWVGPRFSPLRLTKTVEIVAASDRMHIRYALENLDDRPLETWFATELAFNLLAGDATDRYYSSRDRELEDGRMISRGAIENVQQFSLVDEWLQLRIELEMSRPTGVWRFPIETVSMSEAGLERIYQASIVMPNWKIQLQPQESWKVDLTIDLHAMQK